MLQTMLPIPMRPEQIDSCKPCFTQRTLVLTVSVVLLSVLAIFGMLLKVGIAVLTAEGLSPLVVGTDVQLALCLRSKPFRTIGTREGFGLESEESERIRKSRKEDLIQCYVADVPRFNTNSEV